MSSIHLYSLFSLFEELTLSNIKDRAAREKATRRVMTVVDAGYFKKKEEGAERGGVRKVYNNV